MPSDSQHSWDGTDMISATRMPLSTRIYTPSTAQGVSHTCPRSTRQSQEEKHCHAEKTAWVRERSWPRLDNRSLKMQGFQSRLVTPPESMLFPIVKSLTLTFLYALTKPRVPLLGGLIHKSWLLHWVHCERSSRLCHAILYKTEWTFLANSENYFIWKSLKSFNINLT